MLEGFLDLSVRGVARVVVVEAGVDVLRVHPVDQVDLRLGQPSTVDREGIYPDVPQRDGVQRALGQNNGTSSQRGVVEEEASDVGASGIVILRPISTDKSATDNPK